MDVDRLALERAIVAEHLDAIHEVDDAVDFVADEASERQLVGRDGLLEQLRGAADARERVLDLVGEHGGEAGDRTGGAAADQLAVDLVGHGALLEEERDAAVGVR